MKATDNSHVDYDDGDHDDDDDSGTITFLGVSHNSSLGSESGVRVHCTLMEMVSTLTRNNVMYAIPLTYNW